MLLVARALILETSVGRCASGNVVLGAGAELVRFMITIGAGLVVDEDKGVAVVVVLEVASRRSGRDGIANVEDIATDVSFEVFCGFP